MTGVLSSTKTLEDILTAEVEYGGILGRRDNTRKESKRLGRTQTRNSGEGFDRILLEGEEGADNWREKGKTAQGEVAGEGGRSSRSRCNVRLGD